MGQIKTKRDKAVGENPGTIFLDFEEDFEYCVSQKICGDVWSISERTLCTD